MKSITLLSILFSIQAFASERPFDIVDLKQVDSSIAVDMVYFSSGNFIGRPIRGYEANVCYLSQSAAIALKNAQTRLTKYAKDSNQNLTLLVRDCYRPKKAVADFVEWAKSPNETRMKPAFYPNLSKPELIEQNYISPVSGHSRASSVDLTIARINESGALESLPMGSEMDFFGEKSHTDFAGIGLIEKRNRLLLKGVLNPEFKNYGKEWWHYSLIADPYPTTFFDFNVVGPTSPVSPNEILTQLTRADVLALLDQGNLSPLSLTHLYQGIHESQRLPVPSIDPGARPRGDILSGFRESYGVFSDTLSKDIARLTREFGIDWEKDITKTYRPEFAKTASGKELRKYGNVTRVFNEKWLTSPAGQFVLAGISNRIDRKQFTPGTCGELRLIYRLAYETSMNEETYASRLPFLVNMVYTYADDGQNCGSVANRWRLQAAVNDHPVAVAERLLSGPLDARVLRFKQMEVNLQVARFPSDLERMENRGFAGQAVYLMRIFGFENGVFAAKKLENTPDVQAILKSAEKQAELKKYIESHFSAIDQGVFLLPDSLLADVAISYSTLGSSRMANRPFDLLLKPEDANAVTSGHPASAASFQLVRSGRTLLERLNTSTCMGCHQASSTAGFHFLGEDRFDYGANPAKIKAALDGNRLVLPLSPHGYAEVPRRAHYSAALVNQQKPNEFRPHPSAPAASWNDQLPIFKKAGDNMPCPLPGSATDSNAWSCEPGRICQELSSNPKMSNGFGQCTPIHREIYAGLACRKNTIEDHTLSSATHREPFLAYNMLSFRDRLSSDSQIYGLNETRINAAEYNCRPTRIGVPLGRVTKACTPSQIALQGLNIAADPKEICAVVGGKGFEEMAKGYFNSRKFAEGVGRGVLNTCSPSHFCREDYICQEMPDFLTGPRFGVKSEVMKELRQNKIGFCTPTYFVYQLRLDGHPNP